MTDAKLIHGDISIGNVLILPTLVKKDGQWRVEWRGILADWELSKPIPEDGQPHRARQPERTVSVRTMSSFRLRPHTFIGNVAVHVCCLALLGQVAHCRRG